MNYCHLRIIVPFNYCAFQQHTNDQMLLVLLNDNKKIKKTYHYKFLLKIPLESTIPFLKSKDAITLPYKFIFFSKFIQKCLINESQNLFIFFLDCM
jgi:hypothetical protein